MRTKRNFFVSDDLEDLEAFERDLERSGIARSRIHLVTLDEPGAAHHKRLHEVTSLMKTDLLHSMIIGAVTGLAAAVIVLLLAHFAGWTDSAAGWIPFIFLAILVLGFFTWEGGLWGIDKPNVHFRQFEQLLKQGKHLFFVDLKHGKGGTARALLRDHPSVQAVGADRGAPEWLLTAQTRLKHFFTETFP